MCLSVDPLAEQTMEPYSYVGNNPINFTDPTGMSKEGKDDWFVQRETGAVVLSPGQSTLTQEVADAIGAGDASNYDRLGADDMFGDNVPYGGNGANILDRSEAIRIENPESFMKRQGYNKAENVRIKETEYISGGRMGEENFQHVEADLKQIGDSRITYAKKSDMNSKTFATNRSFDGRYSSTKSTTYDLTKPYGQSNYNTAEYHSNRGRNYGNGATFTDNLVKVIKAMFRN